jgi:hypothetical protein
MAWRAIREAFHTFLPVRATIRPFRFRERFFTDTKKPKSIVELDEAYLIRPLSASKSTESIKLKVQASPQVTQSKAYYYLREKGLGAARQA